MLHIEQTLLTKGIKYIQNSLPGSFGSNSNDIHRTKSQEPIDDSSNRSMPPADIGNQMAAVQNPRDRFLFNLDKLIEQLKTNDGVYDPGTLGNLISTCRNANFDFKMDLSECDPALYKNLWYEGQVSRRSYKTDTPVSLIIEDLAIKKKGELIALQLLKLIKDPEQVLVNVYNNMDFQVYAGDIVLENRLIELKDWILENGTCTRQGTDGKFYSTDSDIEKMRSRIDLYRDTIKHELRNKLKSEIKVLFKNSLLKLNRDGFINDNGNISFGWSGDAVTLILETQCDKFLPEDFILEFLQEAKDQGYDFKAFGRDYGIGNLLYQSCINRDSPPSLEVVKFLVKEGIKPKVDLERVPPLPDLAMFLGVEESAPEFLRSSPVALIRSYLISDRTFYSKKARDQWEKILEYFESQA